MYHKKNKKGSLQLSINAIVVLVLAITMLGLGISFTKNMFGKLGDQMLDGIDVEQIANPSSSEPIQLASKTINVQQGGLTAFGVKAMNTGSGTQYLSLSTSEDCESMLDGFLVSTNTVAPGGVIDFRVILDASKDTGSDSSDMTDLKNPGAIQICPLNVGVDDKEDSSNPVILYNTVITIQAK